MANECCDIAGNKIGLNNAWFKSKRADGTEYVPAFVQYVDANKCTGCGMCVRVCMGNCYEMQETTVNGKKKKVSVAVRPKNCLGDCHCHKVCPVQGGAMVCAPKVMR